MATNTIHPGTAMGAVRLRAADIEAMRGFYERAIGLATLESGDSLARLGVDGDVLVELVAAPDAAPRPNGTTGLFHLALLVPDRERLGAALRRVGEAEWALTGASDHLVSEALYTRDPEGNGIEIYRDRPREEWRRTAAGELEMDSLPLDLDSIAAEGEGAGPMAPGTHMGHVHLNVADVADSDDFYSGLVGFEPTVRSYPGALFVSAGGYHHHLGVNTWAGEGAAAPEPGSLGLESFDVILPNGADVDAIASRLSDAGQAVESTDGGIKVADPSSNVVVIRTA
jgi:catechol 2,3-dioxygenase